MRKLVILAISFMSVISLSTCDLFAPGLGTGVDINPPLLFVTSHQNGAYVRGIIALSGNFVEDVATSSITVSVNNGANFSPATCNQTARTWSIDIDTASVPDGEKDVIFRITDTSNKTTEKKILLYFDNTAPLIMMTVPSVYGATTPDYYGSAFYIRGEAADTFGMQSISVRVLNSSDSLISEEAATGTNTWAYVFNSAGDGTDPLHPYVYIPSSGTLRFVAIATDRAGNVSTKFYHNSDIINAFGGNIAIDEVYKYFTAQSGYDSGPLFTFLQNNGTTSIPLHFDQDFNKPTIEIYNPDDTGADNNIFMSTSRLSGKAIDEDSIAANSVKVRIYRTSDVPDTLVQDWISTGNAQAPLVSWSYYLTGSPPYSDGYYTVEVQATDQFLNQRVSAPVGFKIATGVPVVVVNQPTQGQYLNGNFTISGTAADPDGINKVEVSLNNGATYNNATGTTNWSYSVINPPNGSMLIKVKATDNSFMYSTFNLQIFVDKTPPTIGFINPALSATVNGQVIFKGTSSDNTQITKVELKIGKNDPFIELAGTYNWEYSIDSTSYANATHATETPPASNVWKLDVQARATDIANNVTTVTNYYIYIDNDTDKPLVNIIAPSNGQNIAGPVLVSGTAVDDDAVAYVQMQIDINGDGDFADLIDIGDGASKVKNGYTTDRFENETQWYTVTGTTAWTEMINRFGELYARSDTSPPLDGNITIRVRAVDINVPAVTGNYQQISIHLDDTIPRIEDLNLISSDYVHGTFLISGRAKDDVQVSDILVSYNGGVNYSSIIADPTKVTQVNPPYLNDYQISFNINSAAYIPTSGIFYLRFKVIDNANYQTISYINLNVDNVYPTASYTVASDDIYGSSANSRLQGQAWDSGDVSGIEKIELYFIRGGSLFSPKLYNTSTSTTPQEFLDYDELQFPVDAIRSVPYVLESNKTNYVITIDKITELGNDSPPNGDGDGYNESLTLAGSTYNWWAQFNSANIPDGAITIHYVAFDKGGNGHHYTRAGFIKNNKPQITLVRVGTDLNMDGDTEDTYERFDYAGTFYARNRIYVGITASDPGGGIALYEVYHPDLGGTKVLSSSSGDIDISHITGGPATRDDTTHLKDNALIDNPYIVVGHSISIYDTVGNITTTTIQAWDSATGTITLAAPAATSRTYYAIVKDYPEGATTLLIRVTDTDGIVVEQTLNLVIDNFDTIAPVVTLTALAQTDRTSDLVTGGHIELANESIINGPDPDVSGTITLRGHAHDNQRIQFFKMSITNQFGETTLATWPDTLNGGTFGNLTISNVTLNESVGHDFDWTYTWNTANIGGRAGYNITVTVKAVDFNPNSHSQSRDHDVVPYITSLLRGAPELTAENTTRSKYGRYTVQWYDTSTSKGDTNFYIKGYNLSMTGTYGTNSWVRVYNSGGSLYDQVDSSRVSINGSFTQITISDLRDVPRSGFLRLMVNNIQDGNYNNDNARLYNVEDDGNGILASLWTDDRYLHVWQVGAYFGTSGQSLNPLNPSMAIDNSGNLYGAWTNETASSVFYAQPGAARTAIYDEYDPPRYTDIHVDSSGNITIGYLANHWTGGAWNNDYNSEFGAMALWRSGAGVPVQNNTLGSANYYELENLAHDGQLSQFIRPKVVRYGNNMHIAYYDTDTNSLKYSYVLSTSTYCAEHGWINIDGGSDTHDVRYVTGVGTRPNTSTLTDTALIGNTLIAVGQLIYLHDTNENTSSTTISTWNSGTGTITFPVGPATGRIHYTIITTTSNLVTQGAARSTSVGLEDAEQDGLAIDVDEQGYPVIIYYDITNQTLRLARATSLTPTSPSDWYRQTVFQAGDANKNSAGWHVNMKFDASGNLYAACYRIPSSDLIYLYAPNNAGGGDYSFTDSTAVDTAGGVGARTDITLNGTTPYISYLNSGQGYNGLKLAYYDTGKSNWEYEIAPINTPIKDAKTNIEYKKGSVTWTLAIGYRGTNFDIVYLLPER